MANLLSTTITGNLTVDTNVLYVDSTNNRVGIGTTSPDATLRIDTVASAALKFSRTGSSIYGFEIGGTTFGLWDYTASTYKWRTSGSNVLIAESIGNVGIGTTSPETRLHVQETNAGAAGGMLYLKNNTESSGTYTGIYFGTWGKKSGIFHKQGSYGGYGTGDLIFATNTVLDGTIVSPTDARMVITNPGNVGIGTASPNHKLTVYTDATSGVELIGQDGGNQNSDSSKIIFNGHAQDNGPFIQAINTSAYGIKRLGFFVNRTASDYTTLPTESVSITNSGNVGIGTTSPNAKLAIKDGSNADLEFFSESSGTALQSYNRTTSTWGYLRFLAGGGEKMRIHTDGNIGIGTTSPGKTLSVVGAPYEPISWQRTSGTTGYLYSDSGGVGMYTGTSFNQAGIYMIANTSMDFRVNGAQRMYINSAGNVGIGTTSPATSLDVNGTISSGGSPIAWFSGNYNRIYRPNGTVGIYLGNSSDEGNYYDNTTHYFRSAAGVTNRMIINSSGNVLIGTTTDSGYKLDVAGNARANNVILGTDQTYGGNYRSVSFGNNADGANRIFATSDTGDGMYFAAATGRGFRFRPNGGSSDLLTIDSSGNVGIGTTAPSGKLDVRGGKTYLSPLGNSGSGIDSHALVLRNLNDTAFTANALTAYNAHTSWDIENYSTFTASPRVNDASIYTYAGENASASVAVTRFVQFNSANTSPLLDWTFFQWDGAGTSALDLKKPSKLWTVKTYENGGVVEKMSLSGDGDMYIAGNVGIGTTNPDSKLNIISGAKGIHIDKGSYSSTAANLSECRTIYAFAYDTLRNGSTTGFFITNVSTNVPAMQAVDSSNNAQNISIQPFGGNVGIGTTAPSYNLQVTGASTATIGIISNNEGKSYLRMHTNTNEGVYFEADDGSTNHLYIRNAGDNAYLMAIDRSNGNVGIGTNSPTEKLEVQNGTAGAKIKVSNSVGGYASLECSSNATSVAQLSFTNQLSLIGGNVGIGTTSPNRKLSVNGIVGISSATANTQQLVLSVDSGASYITSSYFGTSSYVPMYLEAGGNVRLAILTNGNVGIGTTSPDTKLHVLAASTGYSSDSQIKISDTTTAYYGGLSFDDAGSTRLSIRNSYDGTGSTIGFGFGGSSDKVQIIDGTGLIVNEGNVLIGTTTNNGKKLQVNGDVFIKGSTSSSAYADSIFEVQNSNGTSIMDFRGDAYAFFGCGQGGGAASGFIFRYNDTAHVQFTGYNYGNGAGSYKPILLDTDLVGRSQGVYVNFGGTGYANPAPTSSTEFAVRGRTSDATENVMELRDSNNAEKFVVKNDGSIVTDGSQGWTGTVAIPNNPPGSQNLEFKNGILINVF